MTTSRNLNLRMVAQAGPPSPTPPVFGFQASITSLFLSVAPHRAATSFVTATPALSFPCPGIALVPAFVKEINTFEELGVAAGMLPQEGSAGSVPKLVDFLDDAVSAQVRLPAVQKIVVGRPLRRRGTRIPLSSSRPTSQRSWPTSFAWHDEPFYFGLISSAMAFRMNGLGIAAQ